MSEASPSFNLERINTEFERSFSVCAAVAREMDCLDESMLAAKRVFSYNPNSKKILDLFPQYAPLIEKISVMVTTNGKLLEEDPSNPSLWTNLGYCYLTIGDFPNAFAAYSHALRIVSDSKDTVFWYAMGVVYAHYNYSDHGLSCLEKALKYDSTFTYRQDILFRKGILHRALGDYEQSRLSFEAVLSDPPNGLLTEDVQLQIAYTYQLAKNYDAAMRIYTDLYKRFPNSIQLIIQYAWFMFLQAKSNDDLLRVSRMIEHGLQISPKDPTLLLIAARIAMKQEDMSTAYQHYRFCISYCSENPFFWCGLGVLYYKNDQNSDAIVAFQRALYLKSEMPEAWLNLGLILEQDGDFGSAHKIYQTGQGKCPNCGEFANRLNNVMASQRTGYKAVNCHLIDVDDMKFIQATPDVFANSYIAAVPELPSSCFGDDEHNDFTALATYPRSYFA